MRIRPQQATKEQLEAQSEYFPHWTIKELLALLITSHLLTAALMTQESNDDPQPVQTDNRNP